MTRSEATAIMFDYLEIIYEINETPDFFEFIGTMGGDSLCYRVYKENGVICQK